MTTYQAISSPQVPHPFALLNASDNFIFVSGTVGWGETAAEQARSSLEQISTLLENAGSSLSEIVYIRPIITKREYIPEVDSVIRELLPEPRPASAAMLICELAAPEFFVEFEAIAQRGATLSPVII